MRAFIAHGEADQAIADELKDYLRPWGLFAETESGQRGFRHLQKSDVVIALWSRNALFTPHRMMLEKRMLDAWADGQLVLVKLDHHFLPVGLRDLPSIDASFEAARKTTAWRQVAREAKERINTLLVQAQTPPPPAASAPPPDGPFSPGERTTFASPRADRRTQVSAPKPGSPEPHAKAHKGGNWFLPLSAVVLILGILAVGANILIERFSGDHGAETEVAQETVEPPPEPQGQDMRVTADFLTLLQNADLANGAAEAAKCQMCHAFTPDGPVMLGPPLYDMIGRDIASIEGFPYSSGEQGLTDAEGVWTYRNLNEFLERPKAIAENTTMFFAGIPRDSARADLIAYMRTLTPGELAPLPEALPPGETLDGEGGETVTAGPETEEDHGEDTVAAPSGPMRELADMSDEMLTEPLMLAGAALVLSALMIFIMKLSRDAARRTRVAQATAAAPDTQPAPEPLPAEIMAAVEEAGPDGAVFISYAHDDNDRVEPVVRIVKSNGREVWIDKGGIQAGDGWAGEIVRAIKSAGGVMVMCSQSAFESDHIKREIYLADRYKKQILPIFLEPAQPPEDFEYFFAGVQWLELFKLPEADRAGAIGRALAAV